MPDIRDFLMPDLGEGLTEGEIIDWLVAVGDDVAVDQPIAEMSTEKAIVQVPSPFAGRVVTLHGAPGDLIAVGRPLISIEVAGGTPDGAGSGNVLVGYGTNEPAAPAARRRRVILGEAAAPAVTSGGVAAPAASPLVRRLAAERGIDVSSVTGTGPGGIVTRADIERAGAAEAPTADAAAADGARHRLAGVERVAAERLTRSHREVPTATAWVIADATRLLQLRDRLNASQRDVHVTPFAVLLRVCVRALLRFPRLNSHFDAASNEIVTFDGIQLGVAVQTERGLIVPVIRDAEQAPVLRLAAELERLAAGARDGSLDAAALSGSTFTVSNFGAFGVDGGIALINPPEAAILGVGQIVERPWIVAGELAARRVVELSLVFDHRVADGALAGSFVRHLADLIEDPSGEVDDA